MRPQGRGYWRFHVILDDGIWLVRFSQEARELIELISENPFASPPPYEALIGDLRGAYSRRINIQHRLVYEVIEDDNIVKVLRLWTHYE